MEKHPHPTYPRREESKSVVPDLMEVYDALTQSSTPQTVPPHHSQEAHPLDQRQQQQRQQEYQKSNDRAENIADITRPLAHPSCSSECYALPAPPSQSQQALPPSAAPTPGRSSRSLGKSKRIRPSMSESSLEGAESEGGVSQTESSGGIGCGGVVGLHSLVMGRKKRFQSSADKTEEQDTNNLQYTESNSTDRISRAKKGKSSSSDLRWSKRFTWSDEMHRDFVKAVFDVGLKHSSPSAILEHMRTNPHATSERVKSHLQKYRLHREKSRKEFLASYDCALEELTNRHAASAETEGGGNSEEGVGVSLNCGEAAAQCSHVVMTEGHDPDNGKVYGSKHTPRQCSKKSLATGGTAAARKSEDFPAQEHAVGTVSSSGEPGRLSCLNLPLLTLEERESPLGQSFGYLVGMFQSLSQQLKVQRNAKGGATEACGAAEEVVGGTDSGGDGVSHNQAHVNNQQSQNHTNIQQMVASAASLYSNDPSIYKVAASVPHTIVMGQHPPWVENTVSQHHNPEEVGTMANHVSAQATVGNAVHTNQHQHDPHGVSCHHGQVPSAAAPPVSATTQYINSSRAVQPLDHHHHCPQQVQGHPPKTAMQVQRPHSSHIHHPPNGNPVTISYHSFAVQGTQDHVSTAAGGATPSVPLLQVPNRYGASAKGPPSSSAQAAPVPQDTWYAPPSSGQHRQANSEQHQRHQHHVHVPSIAPRPLDTLDHWNNGPATIVSTGSRAASVAGPHTPPDYNAEDTSTIIASLSVDIGGNTISNYKGATTGAPKSDDATSNQGINTASSSTLSGTGTGCTLQAQKESNMMKREMQDQMKFQNKMRALKQIELRKYSNGVSEGSGGINGTVTSSPDLEKTKENRHTRIVKYDSNDANTGREKETHPNWTTHSSVDTLTVKNEAPDHSNVSWGNSNACTPSGEGADEATNADGASTKQVSGRGGSEGSEDRNTPAPASLPNPPIPTLLRPHAMSESNYQDFWNTEEVDAQLFDFLMET